MSSPGNDRDFVIATGSNLGTPKQVGLKKRALSFTPCSSPDHQHLGRLSRAKSMDITRGDVKEANLPVIGKRHNSEMSSSGGSTGPESIASRVQLHDTPRLSFVEDGRDLPVLAATDARPDSLNQGNTHSSYSNKVMMNLEERRERLYKFVSRRRNLWMQNRDRPDVLRSWIRDHSLGNGEFEGKRRSFVVPSRLHSAAPIELPPKIPQEDSTILRVGCVFTTMTLLSTILMLLRLPYLVRRCTACLIVYSKLLSC